MQICTTSESVQACSASSCAILHKYKSAQICRRRDLCLVGPVQVCGPADLHETSCALPLLTHVGCVLAVSN